MEINLTILAIFFVFIAVAVAFYAQSKGRNPYVWGALALVPSLNIILLIVLFFLSAKESKADHQAHT